VLFTTDYTLSESQHIEFAISWPAKLNGAISLQLVALGLVVRAEETQAAITIERYEFKTCSSTAFSETRQSSTAGELPLVHAVAGGLDSETSVRAWARFLD
jgi:hypothetical protein